MNALNILYTIIGVLVLALLVVSWNISMDVFYKVCVFVLPLAAIRMIRAVLLIKTNK